MQKTFLCLTVDFHVKNCFNTAPSRLRSNQQLFMKRGVREKTQFAIYKQQPQLFLHFAGCCITYPAQRRMFTTVDSRMEQIQMDKRLYF